MTALALAAPGAAIAETVEVTTGDDDPGAGCTLRDAVNSIRTDSDVGACTRTALANPDDLILAADVGTITLDGAPDENVNASGDIDIIGTITIDLGDTTIDAQQNDRIFDLQGGADLTLNGGTLTNGLTPAGVDGALSASDRVGEPGGAIRMASGDLVLNGTRVGGNAAGRGGNGADGDMSTVPTAGGSGGSGGAIAASSAGSTITLVDAQLVENSAGAGARGGKAGAPGHDGGAGGQGGNGGAIWGKADLSITGSRLEDNASGNAGKGGAAVGGASGMDYANGGSGARAGDGGAISIQDDTASVDIVDSVVSGNRSGDGGSGGSSTGSPGGSGGTAFAGGAGGALYVISSSVQVDIATSTIAGNRTGDGGDGGTTEDATRTSRNGAIGGVGGAIYIANGSAVSVVGSTLRGNRTGDGGDGGDGGSSGAGSGGNGGAGGAVEAYLGSLEMLGVLMDGNRTGDGGEPGTGGTPAGGNGGDGGALHINVFGATTDIANSTIAANGTGTGEADGDGGGIASREDDQTLRHVTVSGNRKGIGGSMTPSNLASPGGGTILLERSIIHDGACEDPAEVIVSEPATTIVDDAAGCAGTSGDPGLEPLADNGGPTETMAIGPGSDALDLIDPDASCGGAVAFDQRGPSFLRPRNGKCDAGAFEFLVAPVITTPPVISGSPAVGETLTCSGEVVDGESVTVTRQWRRDGLEIPGATGTTYGVVNADAGTQLDCVVTATNASGSDSAAATAVGIPDPSDPTDPTDPEVTDFDVTAKKSQKQKGKKIKIKVSAGAAEQISVKGSGKVKTKKPKKSYKLKPQTKDVEGGERVVLKLKPKSKKEFKKISKAIKKWKKAPRKKKQKLAVKAPLKVIGTDAEGNKQVEKRVVTLK